VKSQGLENQWEVDGKKGTIGHVMVTYKSGGIMILSAGHWVELSRLDVNFENLERVA